MPKSATDTMRDIIAAAILDGIKALKAGAGGLPNALLRDINAIHANTSVGDLPPAVQHAIDGSVRAAFGRLKKEGYTVAETASVRAAPSSGSAPWPPRPSPGGRPSRPTRPPTPRGPAKR